MNTLTRLGLAFVVSAILMTTTFRPLVMFVQNTPVFVFTQTVSILGPSLDTTKMMEVVLFSAVILFYLGAGLLFTEVANFVATAIYEAIANLSILLGKGLTRGFAALKRCLGYTIVS